MAQGAAVRGIGRALLAAAAVEAAAGVLGACLIFAAGLGTQRQGVFAGCTLGAALADMVLVPGWVWAAGSGVAVRLLARLLFAACAIVAAMYAYVAVATVGLLLFGGLAATVPPAFLMVPFAAAGAVVGLAAMGAERWDWRPGVVRCSWPTHVAGGIAGVMAVLLLIVGVDYAPARTLVEPVWWPLVVLMPLTLVLGGGFRHGLMVREAVRSGAGLADPGPMARRAWVCCLGLAALSAGVLAWM